jgi:RNA polymerase sigma factor (TIGR02999 family)
MGSPQRVTEVLQAMKDGAPGAASELMDLVYSELRGLARAKLQGSPGHTLQATALVHEAYLKLFGSEPGAWQDRAHFFAAAARAMRSVLVDHARARQAVKRGGGAQRVTLSTALGSADDGAFEVLAVHEALAKLEAVDPRKARLVELLFFAGLNVEEAAAVLELSPRTVKRDWRFARTWLFKELS